MAIYISELIYKCRLCQQQVYWTSSDTIPLSIGVGVKEVIPIVGDVRAHNCYNDAIGICDLIGFNTKEQA